MVDPSPRDLDDGNDREPDSSKGMLDRVVQIALTLYLIPAVLLVCLVGVIAIVITTTVRVISSLATRIKLRFRSTDDLL